MSSALPEDTLLAICHYGLLAPSAHNQQPWEFRINDKTIGVRLAKKRLLEAGDPIGRQTWLGIGACVETMAIAAGAQGYRTALQFAQDEVSLSFHRAKVEEPIQLETLEERFTDRSKYTGSTLDPSLAQQIEASWKPGDAVVMVVTDPSVIKAASEYIAKGLRMAMSSPAFRKELSALVNKPLSTKKTGFSSQSLRLSPVRGFIEPYLIRSGLTASQQAKQERQIWQSASALVLTFTKGDTPKYWIEAGRAYQRAGLTASQLGLRQATSAAIVEAVDFHTDIESMVGTPLRLQTVMRIGYSTAPRVHSPRLTLDEVLITSRQANA